jgi:hypothetical protein
MAYTPVLGHCEGRERVRGKRDGAPQRRHFSPKACIVGDVRRRPSNRQSTI